MQDSKRFRIEADLVLKINAAQIERMWEIWIYSRIAWLHWARRVANSLKTGHPPRLCFKRINRKRIVCASSRMGHMIAATAD